MKNQKENTHQLSGKLKNIFSKLKKKPDKAVNNSGHSIDTNVEIIHLQHLEMAMTEFEQSDRTDMDAFKKIMLTLPSVPMIFPVSIDMEAMLGNQSPETWKKGDTIQPKKDVEMKILTLNVSGSEELIPMFTSSEEVNKGQPVSTIRYGMKEYLPALLKSNKTVVINPFSSNRFVMTVDMMRDILLPIMLNDLHE